MENREIFIKEVSDAAPETGMNGLPLYSLSFEPGFGSDGKYNIQLGWYMCYEEKAKLFSTIAKIAEKHGIELHRSSLSWSYFDDVVHNDFSRVANDIVEAYSSFTVFNKYETEYAEDEAYMSLKKAIEHGFFESLADALHLIEAKSNPSENRILADFILLNSEPFFPLRVLRAHYNKRRIRNECDIKE